MRSSDSSLQRGLRGLARLLGLRHWLVLHRPHVPPGNLSLSSRRDGPAEEGHSPGHAQDLMSAVCSVGFGTMCPFMPAFDPLLLRSSC